MRAGYVDRLLAEADGAVATIWITGLLTVDGPPPVEALRRALAALVAETPRLRVRWGPGPRWSARDVTSAALAGSLRELPPATLADATAALLAAPVDLARELPLRVSVGPLTDGDAPRSLVAVQLHHALGDARSLLYLTRRLWEWCADAPRPGSRLGDPAMSDRRALLAAARHPRGLAAVADPARRVLAARGQCLRRTGEAIGAPMLRSLRVPLPTDTPPAARSSLFFAAVLAGAAALRADAPARAPLRLRVPVDLRRELGLGVTLENACSALAVELPDDALTAALADPARLRALVPAALRALLDAGVHWGTLVECMLVSRLATRAMLRDHLRPDLVAARRANTLVVTYVGTVDRYFRDLPWAARTLQTHTPTWGANGFSFRDALVINCSAFEGLWSPAALDAFVAAMRDWVDHHHGPGAERVA